MLETSQNYAKQFFKYFWNNDLTGPTVDATILESLEALKSTRLKKIRSRSLSPKSSQSNLQLQRTRSKSLSSSINVYRLKNTYGPTLDSTVFETTYFLKNVVTFPNINYSTLYTNHQHMSLPKPSNVAVTALHSSPSSSIHIAHMPNNESLTKNHLTPFLRANVLESKTQNDPIVNNNSKTFDEVDIQTRLHSSQGKNSEVNTQHLRHSVSEPTIPVKQQERRRSHPLHARPEKHRFSTVSQTSNHSPECPLHQPPLEEHPSPSFIKTTERDPPNVSPVIKVEETAAPTFSQAAQLGRRDSTSVLSPFRRNRKNSIPLPSTLKTDMGVQVNLNETPRWKTKIWKTWDAFASKICHTKVPPISNLVTLQTKTPQEDNKEEAWLTNPDQQHCCCLHFDHSDSETDVEILQAKSAETNHSKSTPKKVRTLWAVARVTEFDDDSKTYEIMPGTAVKPDNVPDVLEGIFAVKGP